MCKSSRRDVSKQSLYTGYQLYRGVDDRVFSSSMCILFYMDVLSPSPRAMSRWIARCALSSFDFKYKRVKMWNVCDVWIWLMIRLGIGSWIFNFLSEVKDLLLGLSRHNFRPSGKGSCPSEFEFAHICRLKVCKHSCCMNRGAWICLSETTSSVKGNRKRCLNIIATACMLGRFELSVSWSVTAIAVFTQSVPQVPWRVICGQRRWRRARQQGEFQASSRVRIEKTWLTTCYGHLAFNHLYMHAYEHVSLGTDCAGLQLWSKPTNQFQMISSRIGGVCVNLSAEVKGSFTLMSNSYTQGLRIWTNTPG